MGLLVDAYIHFDLAEQYDAIKTDTISQGALFRVEAAAALLAAGGMVAVLLYRYVDMGAIGPIPSMYEPLWYTDKTISLVAQAVAALAAVAAIVIARNSVRDREKA